MLSNSVDLKFMNKKCCFCINCLIAIVVVISVSACAKFSKVDPGLISDTLPERPIELSQVSDSSGKAARVVVRIKQPAGMNKLNKISVLQHLQKSFHSELVKLPGLSVEELLAKPVSNENELTELYGKKSVREDIDYVMFITLEEYSSGSGVIEKESLFNKKKYTECNIQVEYKGWVKVFTLPLFDKTVHWKIEGNQSSSFDKITESECKAGFRSELKSLQTKMIDNSVCKSRTNYHNALAPSGHVLSVKRENEDIYFETSLGDELKIKQTNTIYFYHEHSSEAFAEGVVVSVSPKTSWVKLKSIKLDESVYMYDWVRPHYSE